MIRRPPRSTQSRSSAASDVYKRQPLGDVPIIAGEHHALNAHLFQAAHSLAGLAPDHVRHCYGSGRLPVDKYEDDGLALPRNLFNRGVADRNTCLDKVPGTHYKHGRLANVGLRTLAGKRLELLGLGEFETEEFKALPGK